MFDGLVKPLERSAKLLDWNILGTVLIPNVYKIGDINSTDGCEQAKKLASLI